MQTSFVTVLYQHVQGYNAKAGHVAGLPGMTAFHGFQTALAMKISQALRTTFLPGGITIAVENFRLRDGQPSYIWTAANRGSVKPDDIDFPKGATKDQKAKARAQTGFAKNPSTAHEIQGDAVLHLVMAFTNEEGVIVNNHTVAGALSTMRLAGGDLPDEVPRHRSRTVNVFNTYDEALALLPSGTSVLEDATSTFERFLDRYPQQSVFDAFLLFTSNQRRETPTTIAKVPDQATDVSEDVIDNVNVEVSSEASLDDQVILGEQASEGLAAVDPFDDPDMLLLPHRMPVLSGWRLLNEPEILPTVQRVPGAPAAMVEAVHGVVFARPAGVIRFERSKAKEHKTPAPPTHFRWTWHRLGEAKAGLMVGRGDV